MGRVLVIGYQAADDDVDLDLVTRRQCPQHLAAVVGHAALLGRIRRAEGQALHRLTKDGAFVNVGGPARGPSLVMTAVGAA
ncbi:MAG: hypothetical protein GEU28_04390 [Dehalococcoidia bacterium]|nr:hypothetical protein [Dehalococcoidia bacterium]